MAITLNSGYKMPIVGLGVWRMEGKDMKDLLINAIKIGYRHFDCAGKLLFLDSTFLLFSFLNLDYIHRNSSSVWIATLNVIS